MIDKQIIELPGMKRLMGLLAGLSFLQALFIIGQAYGLASGITGLWEGQSLGLDSTVLLFVFRSPGHCLFSDKEIRQL